MTPAIATRTCSSDRHRPVRSCCAVCAFRPASQIRAVFATRRSRTMSLYPIASSARTSRNGARSARRSVSSLCGSKRNRARRSPVNGGLERFCSCSGSGSFGQIHLQNGHVEGVGDLAVLLVFEDDADELAGDLDLHGIVLLRTLDNRDRVETKQVAQIFFQTPDFAAGQDLLLF